MEEEITQWDSRIRNNKKISAPHYPVAWNFVADEVQGIARKTKGDHGIQKRVVRDGRMESGE